MKKKYVQLNIKCKKFSCLELSSPGEVKAKTSGQIAKTNTLPYVQNSSGEKQKFVLKQNSHNKNN